MHALVRITGEMSEGFLGSSPLAKKSENFTSNRSSGDGQLPSEIIKKQPTVLPVGEQAPSASQLDPIPHLLDQPCIPYRNSVRIISSTVIPAALALRGNPKTWGNPNTADPEMRTF